MTLTPGICNPNNPFFFFKQHDFYPFVVTFNNVECAPDKLATLIDYIITANSLTLASVIYSVALSLLKSKTKMRIAMFMIAMRNCKAICVKDFTSVFWRT